MKKYYVISKAGEHAYNITIKDNDEDGTVVFSLYRSNNSMWCEPNKHVMDIVNHDDLTMTIPKMNRRIDISTASDLTLLLRFIELYEQGIHLDELSYDIIEAESGYKI